MCPTLSLRYEAYTSLGNSWSIRNFIFEFKKFNDFFKLLDLVGNFPNILKFLFSFLICKSKAMILGNF